MKLFPAFILIALAVAAKAQDAPNALQDASSFNAKTKFVSFGLGFPNLYRLNYEVPAEYTHIKTTGIGPLYIKFESALTKNIGLSGNFGYSTFHYVYNGWAIFPSGPEKVIYRDDVNVLNFGLSGNYHFSTLNLPKLDMYAGAGASLNYLHYIYSNIPPYKDPKTDLKLVPLIKAGCKYYLERNLAIFGEAGYDGSSIIVAGFCIRF